MAKLAKIAVCTLMALLLSVPAFSGSAPRKGSYVSTVTGSIYNGGATVLDKAEGLFSGCLKRTFGLFNPCLDFIQGCTGYVLAPIEKPLAYLDRYAGKAKSKQAASSVPTPKKPELSK